MKRPAPVVSVCLLLLVACAQSQPAPTALPSATATTAPTATMAPAATATMASTISPEAAAYLEEALDILEANSINRLETDWVETRALAAKLARHAQEPADIHVVIGYLLPAVGTQHSFLVTPDQLAEAAQATLADSPPPLAKLLPNRLGYVAIEGLFTNSQEQATEYASLVQQLIREVDAQAPCGWIVDLRGNTGGNMWPMLTGLGPILGEGVAGKLIEPDGREVVWSYREGQSFLDDEIMTRVNGQAYQIRAEAPPVAVLIGPMTASSGEAIAIAFRGRPHTRSFGALTAGLSTANQGFPLSDGAMIILTTAVMADRTGQTYGSSISPDESVEHGDPYALIAEVRLPQRAIDWLTNEPACTAP